jgi:hypothetical protein
MVLPNRMSLSPGLLWLTVNLAPIIHCFSQYYYLFYIPRTMVWTRSTQPRDYKWGATYRKSSGSGLENREYGRRDPSRWQRGTLYPQKLAITSSTSGGRSVGTVRSRTKATELCFFKDCFVCPLGHAYPKLKTTALKPRGRYMYTTCFNI